jgi:catalase
MPDDPYDEVLGQQLIDAVHAVSGKHEGHRALHARGIGATGSFTASGAADPITTAPHLKHGAIVPVTVRFSNGTGNPAQSDAIRDGRGMAVKFHLVDRTTTDAVALSMPVFFVRNTTDFLELMKARIPDPDTGEMDLNKVFAFLGDHPEAARAAELSVSLPAPTSYAETRFYGVHAFWFIDPSGMRRKVRYHWEPNAGVHSLSDEEAQHKPEDYLQTELANRLAEGPVLFTLRLTIGTDEDDETDPTREWPDERETIDAGTLKLTHLPEDPETVDEMIFDPMRLPLGIEATDDHILHARSAAYGVSYQLRTR